MATKFKRNFWQGYKGYKGKTLDQTESELRDDIPADDLQLQMLKVLAGGQIAEERRRAAFYDTNNPETEPDDIEEIDAGSSAESFDYITAYNQMKRRQVELWKASQEALKKPEEKTPEKEAKKQPEAPESAQGGVNKT